MSKITNGLLILSINLWRCSDENKYFVGFMEIPL